MKYVPKRQQDIFQLKQNISATCSWVNKLHSYTGYIIPIITYCSQAWPPSRANLVSFERVQVMATKWILNCNLDYKGRLVELKLLPLCLYVEMHDLLMYLSLVNSKYDISIAVESSKEEKNSPTQQRRTCSQQKQTEQIRRILFSQNKTLTLHRHQTLRKIWEPT